MVLTDIQRRALELLAKQSRRMRPGEIGSELWDGFRAPQCYARPAGKVLKRLEELGLVRWESREHELRGDWGWRITERGRDVLGKLGEAR